MIGAREYASLFKKSQQHGKLYLQVDSHARGKTFHIWVLPNTDPISDTIYRTKDAIEVYGITGGQPGWSETYGWLHRGKWEHDFEQLVKNKKLEVEAEKERERARKEEAAARKKARIKKLLDAY